MLLTLTLIALSSAPSDAGVGESLLEQFAATRGFRAGLPVQPRITPDGQAVLFLRSGARRFDQRLYEFDVATGQTRELLSPQALLEGAKEELSVAEKAMLERQRISASGITHYQLSEDGARVLVGLSGRLFWLERKTGKVHPLRTGEGYALQPRFSPDGQRVAFVRDHDLHVVEVATHKVRRLTRGASPALTRGLAEFVAQEEMDRTDGFWWSPDSKQLAYQEVDHQGVERFSIADPTQPQVEANSFFYPRAGKANVHVRLGVIGASGGSTTWVRWDSARFPYLATVRWSAKAPLTVLVQNREQTEEQLLSVDPRTGKGEVLLVERDEAWLNLEQKFPLWLPDGSGFFWATERHGAPEIELRGAKGELKSSWAKSSGEFVLEPGHLGGYDPKTGWLYVAARPNPTESRVYRFRQGEKPEPVPTGLRERGEEEALASKDGGVLVVTRSTLTSMPKTLVMRPDGAVVGELPSEAETPAVRLNLEVRRVGEGAGLWTALVRPRGAKPGVRLPVVLEVYGGPGRVTISQSLRPNVRSQWLADQGFLVVKVDGRGTPHRGRAFERALKGDFAGVTLDDQVAGLRALAKEVPELDLARVGAYGWSFGGYMAALAVLKRPDVFRSGVAGAPVVDWSDYDTHYTERYLGLPAANSDGY